MIRNISQYFVDSKRRDKRDSILIHVLVVCVQQFFFYGLCLMILNYLPIFVWFCKSDIRISQNN